MNLHHLDTNDLVRQSTIARRLNVTNQAVANWLTRNPTYHRGLTAPPIPFPPPALPPIDGVEFWHWPTVKDWAIKSGKATE